MRRFVAQVKPQLVRAEGGDDDARPRRDQFNVHETARSPTSPSCSRRRSSRSTRAAFNAHPRARIPTSRCRPNIPTTRRSSRSRSIYNETPPQLTPCAADAPQQLGLSDRCSRARRGYVVCYGVRDTSRPARRRRPRPDRIRQERARRWRWPSGYGGEIINCDSTAVYRGFDIGTDKVPPPSSGAAFRIT